MNLFLTVCVISVRTPSKQRSPKKEGDIDIVELLRGHDPKDYERILTEHGIHDYRAILQAIEFLKREKEMETGKVVKIETPSIMNLWRGSKLGLNVHSVIMREL